MQLIELFVNSPDGVELVAIFEGGNVFGLYDFEMVDFTIYQRDDVCLANIRHIYNTLSRAFSVGNGLEFELGDVVTVQDAQKSQLLYSR